MSVNSSSFDDLSLLSPYLLTSNLSVTFYTNACYSLGISIFIFSALSITSFLFLLLFILVLYLVFQQWKKQRSSSTTATGHSDLFMYHSIAMQLIEFLGFICFFYGGYMNLSLMAGGLYICTLMTIGQTQFHILTSVEHYLAVVHPITYLGLKQVGEVRIRNISAGCVWLLSFGWVAVYYQTNNNLYSIVYYSTLGFFFIVISFCSISVLCTLKHPGPGEVGGNKEQVDKSKKRAFYTIMGIMSVLLFRFVGNLIVSLIYNLAVVEPENYCVIFMSICWIDMPSSVMLPMLFLQRMGKLQCCIQNTNSA